MPAPAKSACVLLSLPNARTGLRCWSFPSHARTQAISMAPRDAAVLAACARLCWYRRRAVEAAFLLRKAARRNGRVLQSTWARAAYTQGIAALADGPDAAGSSGGGSSAAQRARDKPARPRRRRAPSPIFGKHISCAELSTGGSPMREARGGVVEGSSGRGGGDVHGGSGVGVHLSDAVVGRVIASCRQPRAAPGLAQMPARAGEETGLRGAVASPAFLPGRHSSPEQVARLAVQAPALQGADAQQLHSHGVAPQEVVVMSSSSPERAACVDQAQVGRRPTFPILEHKSSISSIPRASTDSLLTTIP